MNQDELSREAFAELVIRELTKQGVTDRPSQRGMPLLSDTAWTAERTYKALLFHQPRAPNSGVTALAAVLERKSLTDESKDDPLMSDHWLKVTDTFRDGISSLVSMNPSLESSRLASALFVDCVHISLFGESNAGSWLELDACAMASELSGSYLRDHRPQDVKVWADKVADIALRFERIGNIENFKKYLHVLRECVSVEAENCAVSAISMTRFEAVLESFLRCQPLTEVREKVSVSQGDADSVIIDFWDTFNGLFRDCKKHTMAGTKVSERSLSLLPTIKEQLFAEDACKLRPALVASALSVVDVMISSRQYQESALRTVFGGGIVRFACMAWGERVYAPHDTFLGTFLLRIAWKSDKAGDFMITVDSVRDRALSKDATSLSGAERALWPLVLAISSTSPDSKLHRMHAATLSIERLQSLDERAAGPFIRYLAAYPALTEKLRSWEHATTLLGAVEKLRPKKPSPEESTSKESADEDFAKAHATFKRVLGRLRGDGGSID